MADCEWPVGVIVECNRVEQLSRKLPSDLRNTNPNENIIIIG